MDLALAKHKTSNLVTHRKGLFLQDVYQNELCVTAIYGAILPIWPNLDGDDLPNLLLATEGLPLSGLASRMREVMSLYDLPAVIRGWPLLQSQA